MIEDNGFAVRVSKDLWLSTYRTKSEERVLASAYRQLYATRNEADRVRASWMSGMPPAATEDQARTDPRVVEIKTTVLPSHLASGDCECFCFDARTLAERRELRLEFERSMSDASLKGEAEDALYAAYLTQDGDSRVYPNVLLPDTGGRKGRWKIVVEFEPEP